MRSNAGVGTTPPNVPGAPNPQSSVMITRTLGACFGGTTRGGHHGFESVAFSLITPPNFGSGGGSCLPSIVVVAPGEPGTPVVYCAKAGDAKMRQAMLTPRAIVVRKGPSVFGCIGRLLMSRAPRPEIGVVDGQQVQSE